MRNDDFYGDKFKWFIGVVKDSYGDKNRVRVRIFGIHHTDDITNVSDGDLPPALVLYPTTGGQTSGGNLSHGLKPGTWVFGFFADGDDCQQPIILGVVDGGTNSSSNAQAYNGASTPGASGSAGDGASTPTNPGTGSATLNLPGNSNIEKAYNMIRDLIEKSGRSGGDVHAQVSGILGNILEESGCNPNSNNGNDKGQRSYGICQWREGKYDRLTALFRQYGPTPTLDQQISYMWNEFMTTEQKAFKRIMAARNVYEAVIGMVFFERPECFKGSYVDTTNHTFPGRLTNANKVYNTIKYTPIASSSGGSSSSMGPR
ncbi:hypothetical protein UFOVP247_97 [uncultured Caudovirales phage]|uniref:Phage tail lysozyme domain-containing protein n=1 Tax=uncultured Caudovirales phage TaxID=2100421 RepID=A0A6J7WT84_9CAUD|nr:hypothetical protein UFOVP247_97 [uncultured Caudovirales phage]